MIKRIQIPDILQPVSHYCHVVEANNIIWISGLVGMNYDNSIPENTKDQFDIAMRDFDTCLKAAGGEITNLDNEPLSYDFNEKRTYNQGGIIVASNNCINQMKICSEIKQILEKYNLYQVSS